MFLVVIPHKVVVGFKGKTQPARMTEELLARMLTQHGREDLQVRLNPSEVRVVEVPVKALIGS